MAATLRALERTQLLRIVTPLLLLSPVASGVAHADRDSAPDAETTAASCRRLPAALQILGSGGPLNPEGRASTSYVLWQKGRPALVVDLGPGSVSNLVRAGARLTALQAILLSHLHPDHVSDLPGLVWDEDILERQSPLLIVGPTGGRDFPDVASFLARLFGTTGAFPFMQGVLDPGSRFHLDARVIDTSAKRAIHVTRLGGLAISAFPVSHGKAPSLAYRIDADAFSVVFGGDQTATDPGFADFARQADVLVLHAALSPQAAAHPFARVIALPESLGALAAASEAKRLVLSHLMALPAGDPRAVDFSLADRDRLLAAVRSAYRGRVTLASDLECIALAPL